MFFQAYMDNIKTKTGKTPEDFKKLAEKKGLLKPGGQGDGNRCLAKKGTRTGAWSCHGHLRHLQRKERMKLSFSRSREINEGMSPGNPDPWSDLTKA
jgi:hypothetical protein